MVARKWGYRFVNFVVCISLRRVDRPCHITYWTHCVAKRVTVTEERFSPSQNFQRTLDIMASLLHYHQYLTIYKNSSKWSWSRYSLSIMIRLRAGQEKNCGSIPGRLSKSSWQDHNSMGTGRAFHLLTGLWKKCTYFSIPLPHMPSLRAQK